MFPELLACFWIQRQQVRAVVVAAATAHLGVTLQHLHVEDAVMDQRARGERPQEGELPVFLLEVQRPQLVTVHIKRGQFAAAVKKGHNLPIGHRRRRSVVAAVVLPKSFGHLLRPLQRAGLAVVTVCRQPFLLLIGRGDEDVVAPDHRSGGAGTVHLYAPANVFRLAELGWQVFRVGGTVVVWPSPVPPVTSLRPGQRQAKRGSEQHYFSHVHDQSVLLKNCKDGRMLPSAWPSCQPKSA